jgi:putative intracellular protease/amidase
MTTSPLPPRFHRFVLVLAALLGLATLAAAAPADGSIPNYQARFGRQRPVIAIVGENSGTELTDFVIPYGVLAASGAAEVVTVSTQPGMLRMRPALTVQPQETISSFDVRFPDGADYVIVPAVMKYNDPTLLAWVKAQGAKGGTLVSICDGAAVIAATGLMDGHRATAHWASEKFRRKHFSGVTWITDIRYVADGKIVSSAGISAAMPASLALVEAIAGRDRALAIASELGVSEWGTAHHTAQFRPRFGVNLRALISVNYTNRWFRSTEMIGLPIAAGVDEIALAVTADAYTRTGRSMVHALSGSTESVRTRHGLVVIPETLMSSGHRMDRMLPELDATPSGQWFAKSIDGIMLLYGRNTAYGVALDFELPMIPQRAQPTAARISAK